MEQINLTPHQVADLNVAGWHFLHQQGSALCRGGVTGFQHDADGWQLDLRDVEYWRWDARQWQLEKATDVYGSQFGPLWNAWQDANSQIVYIPGYAMETYLAPPSPSPWTDVDWPETDNYPGGPMSHFTG